MDIESPGYGVLPDSLEECSVDKAVLGILVSFQER